MPSPNSAREPETAIKAAGASLAAASDVAERSHDPVRDNPSGFRRILLLVGVGFFIQTIATDSGGLPALPLNLLIKNKLHLPPSMIAQFAFLTGIAWYLKPFAGAFADTITIRGTRYRGYLVLSAIAGAITYALMLILPQTYGSLLATFILLNVFLMLISTVLGGYMVVEGQEFQATGRLSAFRNTAMNATGLIAGVSGGWLAGYNFNWTAGIGVGLMIVLLVFFWTSVKEPDTGARSGPNNFAAIGAKLKQQYGPLLHAKTYWAAVIMTLLVMCMPGFGTPFLYYQTDVLKLTPQFIGNIGSLSGGMSIVGGLAYLFLCRRLNLRAMLALSIALSAAASLFYLLYDHGTTAIIAIEAQNGVLSSLPEIALMDLAARATPKGGESMAYAVLMAVYNLGARIGDVWGSKLYDHFHVPIKELIVISAAMTLVTIVAVPFLPKSLVGMPDGSGLELAGEATGEETPDV